MLIKMTRTELWRENTEQPQEQLLQLALLWPGLLAFSWQAEAFHQLSPHHQVCMDEQMSLCVVVT